MNALRRLVERGVDGAIRLAGGDPHVVRILSAALHRAADGKMELLFEQSRRRGTMSPGAARILLTVLAGLGSVFLCILFVDTDQNPPAGALVLAAGHWLMGTAWLVGRAAPALLNDDDLAVIGWWPLGPRNLMLARVGVMLRDLLPFTAAAATMPLLMFLVTGHPPMLASLLLAAGLLVQSCAMALGVLLFSSLAVMRLGRVRMQRIGALLADGNAMIIIWLVAVMSPRFAHDLTHWSPVHSFLPFAWVAAWADPMQIDRFVLHVALLLGSTVALARLASRLVTSEPTVRTADITESKPAGRHWTDLLDVLLRPWTKTIEGWAVRRLLVAHMRDDWRVLGAIAVIPLMFAAMMLGVFFSGSAVDLDEEVTTSALFAINFSFWLPLYAPMAFSGLLFSSSPQALWPLALADLDGWAILAAQRRVARAMILAPMLAAYGYRALVIGLWWPWVLADMLLLAMCWEVSTLFMQGRLLTMPFSKAMSSYQDISRAATMIIAFIMSLGYIGIFGLIVASPQTAIAGWSVMLAALAIMRRWVRMRSQGRRLSMDLVPES